MAEHAPRAPAVAHSAPAQATGGMTGPAQERLAALQTTLDASPPVQRLAAMAPNRTGMPDGLKRGIEAMSGFSMDHVRVHRNSPKPAQLQAHAYAQGSDIHLAPGQERHLPHEAWHVVQQAQGRVRPTMQMKAGVPVNDDAGLEAEADAMGTRANTWDGPASDSAAPYPAPSHEEAAAPAQLRVDPAPQPNEHPQQPTFAQVAANAFNYGVEQIDWVTQANQIHQTIDGVRQDLPEDEDEAEATTEALDAWDEQTDDLVTTANAHVVTFDNTPHAQRVPVIAELHQDRADLMALLAEIEEEHRVSQGGFGAKGRATAIDDVSVEEDYEGDDDTNDHFISNISVNGANLTDSHTVVREEVAPEAGAQRLRLNGVTRIGQPPLVYNDTLTAVTTPQGVVNRTNFVGADRGPGQEASMNRTNARGYAWATRTDGWNTTQWEWLHVRGASLGGATGPTNLVLGTRDSNTHMMPFESNLKALAAVAQYDERFVGLTANWTLGTQITRHKWETITIDWRLNKTGDAPEELPEPHGSADFAPLNTATVLSKDEVAFLEETLRDGLPQEEEEAEEEGGEMVDEGEAVEEGGDVVEGAPHGEEAMDEGDVDNGEGDDEEEGSMEVSEE